MTHRKPKDEYEQLAPHYDTLLDPILHKIRREICRIALHEEFQDILDVCCGTGKQASMLAGLGFKVSGVDLSPSMLAIAIKKSCGSVNYYLEDASSLHFRDDSFDCAIISFALHEKPPWTRHKILKEVQRVLRTHGRIIIADYLSPDGVLPQLAHILVNAVERMAGKNHHSFYQDYMRAGALETLISKHNLRQVGMRRYYLGSAGLALLESTHAFPDV